VQILEFRREEAENYALLGYYAANCGNFLLTFRDKLSAHKQGSRIQKNSKGLFWVLTPENSDPFEFLTPDDETHRLSRNVGKKLPLLAA